MSMYGSRDFFGSPSAAGEFVRSLVSDTGRNLPTTLKLDGEFQCGDIKVQRCTVQTESSRRLLALNIPVAELGAIARGQHPSRWGNLELGIGLLTAIVESTKSLDFGAFRMFADEQEFLFAAVTHRREGEYQEFGRITPNTFLRFLFELKYHGDDEYAESANAHFMDRLSTMFALIETKGLKLAESWAQYLSVKETELSALATPHKVEIPENLRSGGFERLLRERLQLNLEGLRLPQDVTLCDHDRGYFLQVRVPIKEAFVAHHLKARINSTPREALESFRLSVENEMVLNGLTEHVRVNLRNLSEISRIEPEERESLAEYLKRGAIPYLGRYVLSFDIELDEPFGSPELEAARNKTLAALFQTLDLFKGALGT